MLHIPRIGITECPKKREPKKTQMAIVGRERRLVFSVLGSRFTLHALSERFTILQSGSPCQTFDGFAPINVVWTIFGILPHVGFGDA